MLPQSQTCTVFNSENISILGFRTLISKDLAEKQLNRPNQRDKHSYPSPPATWTEAIVNWVWRQWITPSIFRSRVRSRTDVDKCPGHHEKPSVVVTLETGKDDKGFPGESGAFKVSSKWSDKIHQVSRVQKYSFTDIPHPTTVFHERNEHRIEWPLFYADLSSLRKYLIPDCYFWGSVLWYKETLKPILWNNLPRGKKKEQLFLKTKWKCEIFDNNWIEIVFLELPWVKQQQRMCEQGNSGFSASLILMAHHAAVRFSERTFKGAFSMNLPWSLQSKIPSHDNRVSYSISSAI